MCVDLVHVFHYNLLPALTTATVTTSRNIMTVKIVRQVALTYSAVTSTEFEYLSKS